MKPITLTSERIVLRRGIETDVITLFQNYCSDTDCSRFLTRKPHTNTEQTAKFLKEWCDAPWDEEDNKFAWVVALKETDEAIGVFLVCLQESYKAEIHYGIARNFWKQGLTTELSHLAIEWLMSQPELQRIWAVCDLDNYGSIKILEQIGFEREGILRNWLRLPAFGNSVRDCFIYAKTRAEGPCIQGWRGSF
jgi:ribosomal-protein-alanine N-acetyltransferase